MNRLVPSNNLAAASSALKSDFGGVFTSLAHADPGLASRVDRHH